MTPYTSGAMTINKHEPHLFGPIGSLYCGGYLLAFVAEMRMPKRRKQLSEAPAKNEIYAPPQKEYSEELEKLYKLCSGEEQLEESERKEFVLELDQIVSGYRRRINEKDYFDRIRSCREDLSQVATLLRSSAEKLARLDYNHNLTLMATLEEIAPNTQKDFFGLLSQLTNTGMLASCLDAALYVIAGYDFEKGAGDLTFHTFS